MEKKEGGIHAAYFMGRNTRYGFIGQTEALTENAQRIFLIKGGPGTGKSTLMRHIAERFNGEDEITYFVCSSDPDSLDGISLANHRTALLDATSPHAAEARYPGAVERMIDLGACFDLAVLAKHRDEIMASTDKKAMLFRRIYRYLGVAGQMDDDIRESLSEAFNMRKAMGAMERLLLPYRKEGKGQTRCRQVSSWGMKGRKNLSTFARQSKQLWYIDGPDDCRHFILDALMKAALHLNQSLDISYDAMGKIDALYLPDCQISVLGWQNIGEPQRVIHTSRFFDAESLRQTRKERRQNIALREGVFDRVDELFASVKTVHFGLEDIYRSAMDFAMADKIRDRVIAEIKAL